MNLSNSVSRLLAGTAITIATGLVSTAAVAQDSGDYADNEIICPSSEHLAQIAA
jgi:hypothetical protein